jgi:hypothetical protein
MWGWVIIGLIVLVIIVFIILMSNSVPMICGGDKTPDGLFKLCYSKPKPGYKCTETICLKDSCPSGFDNSGLTCTKKAAGTRQRVGMTCGPGEEGPPCYTKCKDGFKSFAASCLKDCPEGMQNDGLICTTHANSINKDVYKRADIGRLPLKPCPSGTNDVAGSCWQPIKTVTGGYYNYSPGCGTDIVPCHDGSKVCKNDCYKTWLPTSSTTGGGIVLGLADRKTSCNSDEDEVDGLCYPKCRDGYSSPRLDPLHCVSNSCPPGYDNLPYTCFRNVKSIVRESYVRPMLDGKCKEGFTKEGLLCYSNCPPGQKGVLDTCWPECPSEYKDIGVACAKPSYDRGVGLLPDSCPKGKIKFLGKCIGL